VREGAKEEERDRGRTRLRYLVLVTPQPASELFEMSFGAWTRVAQRTKEGGNQLLPPRNGALMGVILEHAENARWSILSTIFARGKDAACCEQCSNLFFYSGYSERPAGSCSS